MVGLNIVGLDVVGLDVASTVGQALRLISVPSSCRLPYSGLFRT